MSPDPYFRYQAGALLVALVANALLAEPWVAIAGAAMTAAVWSIMWATYRVSCQRSGYDPSAAPAFGRRRRLDSEVAAGAAVVVVATALAVGVQQEIWTPVGHLPTYWAVLIGGVALGTSGIYWSSLVDWYWVLPRISGLLGHRPCRPNAEPGARTVSWEELTRWWLVHRVLAVLMVSFGVALTFGGLAGLLLGAAKLSQPAVWVGAAFLGGIPGLVVIFQKKAAEAGPHITRPNVRVGSFYRHEEEGAGWVVDVAVEGGQLVLKEQHHARVTAARSGLLPLFSNVDKADADFSLSERLSRADRFEDCASCSGMNWYCIDNPRAWDRGPDKSTQATVRSVN